MQQPRHWHAMMEKEFFLYQLKSRVWTGIKLHPNIGIIPDIHMKSNMFISCTSFDTLQIRKKKLKTWMTWMSQKYKAPQVHTRWLGSLKLLTKCLSPEKRWYREEKSGVRKTSWATRVLKGQVGQVGVEKREKSKTLLTSCKWPQEADDVMMHSFALVFFSVKFSLA